MTKQCMDTLARSAFRKAGDPQGSSNLYMSSVRERDVCIYISL